MAGESCSCFDFGGRFAATFEGLNEGRESYVGNEVFKRETVSGHEDAGEDREGVVDGGVLNVNLGDKVYVVTGILAGSAESYEGTEPLR